MNREQYIEYERRRRNGSASREGERDHQLDKDRAGGFWPDTFFHVDRDTFDHDRERVPNRDYYDGVGR